MFLVIQQHTFTVIPTMLQSWKLCILAVVLIINLVQSSAKLSNVNLNQQVNLKLNTLSTPSERSSQSFTSLPKKELNILTIRGGKGGKSKIQKIKITGIKEKIQNTLAQIQPVSRYYLYVSLFCTLIHLVGLPAPAWFSLNANRWFELWRPITTLSYLGPLSMSMASNLYFLIRYGQGLETEYGSATYAWFLTLQMVWLTALGMLLNFPYLAQAIIAAIIYVNSRIHPMEKVPFQFGFVISSWQLPFCLMVIDCLSQQSFAPAWMHILGIFTGHLYHFFRTVLPALGGQQKLNPPNIFTRWFPPIDPITGQPVKSEKGHAPKVSLFKKKAQGKKLGNV